jgi:hypothetical protein
LLFAARGERLRDPIILGLSEIAGDPHVSRAALVDLYDRLALALGAGRQALPASEEPPSSS